MSRALRYAFMVHAVVTFVFGAPLLLAPGRFLALFGWAPVDPILSRVLGACLLALAWSSFRGWQATETAQVGTLVEMEAVFTILGAAGVLRHLLTGAYYPWPVWFLFVLLAIFAVAWVYFRFAKPTQLAHGTGA